MNYLRICLAIALLALIGSAACADNEISTSARPGPVAGTVAFSGRVRLDAGWSPKGKVIVNVWKSGEIVMSRECVLTGRSPSYTYSGVFDGLASGTTYNFLVQCPITKGAEAATLASDPLMVAPK